MQKTTTMHKILTLIGLLLTLALSTQTRAQSKNTEAADKAFSNNQFTTAISLYNKLLPRADEKTANYITLQLAESYRLTNDPAKAETWYRKLVTNKYADEHPIVFQHLATALCTQGKYTEALPMFDACLAKMPENTLASAGKATCEMSLLDTTTRSRWKVTQVPELNSAYDDFAPTFADNNYNSIFFTSNRSESTGKEKDNWTNGAFSDLYTATKDKKGNWSTPTSADQRELVNTVANEGTAVFTDKYRRLFFTRCKKTGKETEFCTIYESVRSGNSWTKPEQVFADTLGNSGHPTLSSNGLIMIYASNRPDGSGGRDLWKVTRASERKPFGTPVNLGPLVNTPGDEMFPHLQNDSVLYFASNGRAGFGGLDLYKVVLGKHGPSHVFHLPRPVNSSADDFAMCFQGNQQKGLFASRRDGGKGGDDLYYFEIVVPQILLAGIIKDQTNGQPLETARLFVRDQKGDSLSIRVTNQGTFELKNGELTELNRYTLIASCNNYFARTAELNIPLLLKDSVAYAELQLEPIPEKPIVLPDIYYDLDKWDLLPQYQDTLMVLVKILNDNPKIVIELASHTDARANDVYNEELSQKRAESVVAFLIEKGIDKNRLVARGYGEKVPRQLTHTIIKDGFRFNEGSRLTEKFIQAIRDPRQREAAHQLNRRTEFSVLRTPAFTTL